MDLHSLRNRSIHAGAAAGALLAVACATRPALALNCNDPSLPSPIYAIGGSGPVPIFTKIGTALANATPPQTFIYQSTAGSCSGVYAIVNGQAITGTANYWDKTGATQTCSLPTPLGQAADLGVSGTYADVCAGITTLPSGIGDFIGPVQAYDFIVPFNSSETSISAQAAYFVYGFGASSPYSVAPWTTEPDIITRNANSAAAIIIALGIGVPLATLNAQGTDGKSNGGTLSDVAALNATAPNAGIGFVSGEVADGAAPSTIKVLAYQHYGQSCGWWPSSSATAHDKINVRNGHYALWANIQFLAKVDSTNTPTNANAKEIIGYFDGTVAQPAGVDVDALTVQAGGILDCAMEVKRTSDMGDLQPYAPAAPCGCFFEFQATGATSCKACTTSADCSASATNCRKGYCEVN